MPSTKICLQKNPHLDKIRMINFENLETIIRKSANNKFYKDTKFADVCLESNDTSLLIGKALRR